MSVLLFDVKCCGGNEIFHRMPTNALDGAKKGVEHGVGIVKYIGRVSTVVRAVLAVCLVSNFRTTQPKFSVICNSQS